MVSSVTLHVLCRQFSPLNILTGLATLSYTKSKLLWMFDFVLFWTAVIMLNQIDNNNGNMILNIACSIICILYAMFMYITFHELYVMELKYSKHLHSKDIDKYIPYITDQELYIPCLPYTAIHYVTIEYITLINIAVIYPFVCYNLSKLNLMFTGILTFVSIALCYTLYTLIYTKTCLDENLYIRKSTVYYVLICMILSLMLDVLICYKSRKALLNRKKKVTID